MVVAEQLKPLSQTWLISVPLGQGAHDLGVVSDVGGVLAVHLDERSDQLVNESGHGSGVGTLHLLLNAQLIIELSAFFSFQLSTLGECDAKSLFESYKHGDALEGRTEVNLNHVVLIFLAIGMVLDLVGAVDLVDHLREHLFSEVHEVVVVSIGPIELTCGELGVVSQVNALISELLANLKHSVHSSYDQLLQVQLWCYSHEQLHVQVIMESLEGFGNGTSSNHVHHGSLHFEEVSVSQEGTDEVNDLVPDFEVLLHVLVHYQVQISEPVSGILGQSMQLLVVFSGQHVQTV